MPIAVKQKTNDQSLLETLNQLRVSDFGDYRQFLASLYKRHKSVVHSYSYLKFAADLGFSENNMIRLAIVGKRDLSPATAKTIARSLKFSNEDRSYFLDLVKFQAARSQVDRKDCAKRLLAAQRRMQPDERSQNVMSYFEQWYFPVVRELIRNRKIVRSVQEVCETVFPPLRPSEVQRALDLLVKIGYAKLDVKLGGYVLTDEHDVIVPTHAIANHFAAISYHKQMLRVSEQALEQLDEEKREINSLTLSLSNQGWELLKFRIREFCSSALALEQTNDRGPVIQLNVQAIKITSASEEGDS